MRVMPISVANAMSNANTSVNFSGRKNKNVENETSSIDNKSKSSNLAKVPVVVMIAMSPAMMNAKMPSDGLLDNGAKTEFVMATPEQSQELLAMAFPSEVQPPQADNSNCPMGITELRNKKFVRVDSFYKNGKKCHIAYSTNRSEPNEVHRVLFIPDGYKSELGKKLIPYVKEIIIHDIGPGKEFCGVIVASPVKNQETGKWGATFEEVRLPDEVAQPLIDLYADDAKWTNRTAIKCTFTESAKLRDTFVLK